MTYLEALAQIDRNISDWNANRITWEQFGQRKRVTWNEIEKSPKVRNAVLKTLRERQSKGETI